jgi:AmiR/NasT family two-component response regulator
MSLRVLLAEDDPATAAALAEQLRALGHEVVAEAADGRRAVTLAAERRPDVILMDIRMPDMDGIEAAREIAHTAPRPIVFLSGHFDRELLEGAVDAGGLAYLLKPATTDQLQAALSLAAQRFGELTDLREQVSKLEQALEARKLLARAKGLLMERHGLSEEEAHSRMQKEASRRNVKVVDLCHAIIAAEAVGRSPDEHSGPA